MTKCRQETREEASHRASSDRSYRLRGLCGRVRAKWCIPARRRPGPLVFLPEWLAVRLAAVRTLFVLRLLSTSTGWLAWGARGFERPRLPVGGIARCTRAEDRGARNVKRRLGGGHVQRAQANIVAMARPRRMVPRRTRAANHDDRNDRKHHATSLSWQAGWATLTRTRGLCGSQLHHRLLSSERHGS